jgi:hypothetical protein
MRHRLIIVLSLWTSLLIRPLIMKRAEPG